MRPQAERGTSGLQAAEAYLPASEDGEYVDYVVVGQRRLQASSDVLLDWPATDGGHQQYWRQFRDAKGSADVTTMSPDRLGFYARVCA